MLPPLILFSSLGVLYLFQRKKRWLKLIFLFIITGFFLVEMTFYFHQYFVHYPQDSWRWWQYGYKEPMIYIKDYQSDYEKVLINNTYEPTLVRFLFWTEYDPARFHQEFSGDEAQENILPGFNGFRLDKFYFGTLSRERNFSDFLTPKVLYLAVQREEVDGDWDWRKEPPARIEVLESVTNPAGEPLFYLVTSK